ncbi:MAG TPA: N-acetylneuraminate synthase family protein [Pirellulales bacterium]|nr:N-acetylneuraminate synthase family protein [Pirellulales bacterium]
MQPAAIVIGQRVIGHTGPALVIAEIGQNHNGSLALAEQLIDAAAWAGADAVKLVKRDLESELSREARRRHYDSRHAFGRTYGDHRRALELSADDHARLSRRAAEHGLIYLATACDLPSAGLLDGLGVAAFKIASRDLANLPLLADVAGRGKPVILSTGMSAFDEVDAAVAVLREQDCRFILLQCTSLYPTPFEQVHLRSMNALAERYGSLVGFSDHTPGVLLPPVAVALGAAVIEKHLTLDRNLKGTDHACSLEPDEFRQLVHDVRRVEAALGRADKPVADGVETVRAKLGRSLVTRTPLPAGTRLEEPMLTLKCPGDGLSWFDRRQVVGRRLKRDLPADEKLSLDDIA